MITLLDIYPNGRPRPAALAFLFRLLAERPAEANISHREMPSRARHERFVRSHPYRDWFIVEDPGIEDRRQRWVGSVYLTHLNEIGVAILQKHQGKGYGAAAVGNLMVECKPSKIVNGGRFLANVAPGNDPSRRLFERLGGRIIQVTYEL